MRRLSDDSRRLADQLGCWTDLIALYREVIDDTVDESLKVILETRIAEIYNSELGNIDESAAAYQRILSLDPTQVAPLDALEDLYRRGEQYQNLVDTLLKKADVLIDAEGRLQLLHRSAQIYEDMLDQPDNAISVYKQALEINDEDVEAIGALERLYQREEKWEDLADIFARQSQLATEAEVKKQTLLRLGSLYEEQLDATDQAIETYQHVLDLDSEDSAAIGGLDRLFQKSARWYDLLQVLERQVEITEPHSLEGINLRFRIGRLWQDELGDLQRAIETYREILTLESGHHETVQSLMNLVRGNEEPLLAAQVLEPIYERHEAWDELIEVCEVMITHTEERERKVDLLHKVSDVHERRQSDKQRAFQSYARVLTIDGSDERSQTNMERLAAEIGEWQQLVDSYEAAIGQVSDSNSPGTARS